MHQVPQLSHAEAMTLINAIREAVEPQGKGAAIAVVDAHGDLLAFLRTDGCPLTSITIAINKAYTAAREQKESRLVGEAARENNFPLTNFGELRYVGWGGGFPIAYEGKVVGGIGVSGLPEQEDMDMARLAIKALGLEVVSSLR